MPIAALNESPQATSRPPAGWSGSVVADRRMKIHSRFARLYRTNRQIARSTSIFLVSAIALAGLRPLGQTLAQFMIV